MKLQNEIHSYIQLTLLFSILLCVSACAYIVSVDDSQAFPSLILEDCSIKAANSQTLFDAKCGKLSVYENRQIQSGRMIELNIAIIPAISRNPAPDPIFFIPGGPGEAATESFPPLAPAFRRLNQKRDIVLVDQRGTGGSNPLECEIINGGAQFADNEQSDASLDKILTHCLSQIEADPKYYTTSIAMDDLDQVREALEYEKINLYGASYGTRAALVYLRQHPEQVRTVILDGVAPTNWTLGPTVAADAQRALDMIFNRCLSDITCNQTFPDLPKKFDLSQKQLQNHPKLVSLQDPSSNEWITHTLTYEEFSNTLHLLSYFPETTALIPLILDNSASKQDYSLITAQVLANSTIVQESISNGMRFSVICSEDVPFYPQSETSNGYLGNFITDSFEDICSYWPRGEIPPEFKKPVFSDTPVLLISGELDPVTPPSNGELAAKSLANSLHIVLPGMGHINIYRGCLPTIATTFIETGTYIGIDTSCIQDLHPMPFFVNYNGPTP